MSKAAVFPLLFAVFLILPASAYALAEVGITSDVSSLRCGTNDIRIGALEAEVKKSCGLPTSRTGMEIWGRSEVLGPGALEDWVYNRGATDFIYTLRFEGGHLIRIIRGERGFS